MCMSPCFLNYPSYFHNPISMLADGFKKRPTTTRIHLLIGDRDLCEGCPSVKILQIIISSVCVHCPSADGGSERGGTWDGILLCLCDSGASFLVVHNRQIARRPFLYSSSILCGPLLTEPMYFVFCRLFPSSPSHRGSVWHQYLSSLYS